MLRDFSLELAKLLNLTISCTELLNCMICCLMGFDSNCRSIPNLSKIDLVLAIKINLNLVPVHPPSLTAIVLAWGTGVGNPLSLELPELIRIPVQQIKEIRKGRTTLDKIVPSGRSKQLLVNTGFKLVELSGVGTLIPQMDLVGPSPISSSSIYHLILIPSGVNLGVVTDQFAISLRSGSHFNVLWGYLGLLTDLNPRVTAPSAEEVTPLIVKSLLDYFQILVVLEQLSQPQLPIPIGGVTLLVKSTLFTQEHKFLVQLVKVSGSS